jgi:hypothetical protein
MSPHFGKKTCSKLLKKQVSLCYLEYSSIGGGGGGGLNNRTHPPNHGKPDSSIQSRMILCLAGIKYQLPQNIPPPIHPPLPAPKVTATSPSQSYLQHHVAKKEAKKVI